MSFKYPDPLRTGQLADDRSPDDADDPLDSALESDHGPSRSSMAPPTDWREQLRERVREIRARKSALTAQFDVETGTEVEADTLESAAANPLPQAPMPTTLDLDEMDSGTNLTGSHAGDHKIKIDPLALDSLSDAETTLNRAPIIAAAPLDLFSPIEESKDGTDPTGEMHSRECDLESPTESVDLLPGDGTPTPQITEPAVSSTIESSPRPRLLSDRESRELSSASSTQPELPDEHFMLEYGNQPTSSGLEHAGETTMSVESSVAKPIINPTEYKTFVRESAPAEAQPSLATDPSLSAPDLRAPHLETPPEVEEDEGNIDDISGLGLGQNEGVEELLMEWDIDSLSLPEAVVSAKEQRDSIAPLSDRIAAVLCDGLILASVAVLLIIAGSWASETSWQVLLLSAPLSLGAAWLVLALAYGVFFIGTCGQTLGKMIMRVRVIGIESFCVGYPRAVGRALTYTCAAIPGGLGLLLAFANEERRGIHDTLSRTRVVKA